MAFSRKQLIAIILNLKKRGLWRGAAESRRLKKEALRGTGLKNLGLKPPKGKSIPLRKHGLWKWNEPALTTKDVPWLKSRLPASHHKLSSATEIHIGNPADLAKVSKGSEKVSIRETLQEMRRVEAGLFQGRTGVIKVDSALVSFRGASPGYYTRFPVDRALGKSIERRGKVGASGNFYHEYGHSIDNYRNNFSLSKRWIGIVQREWRPTTSKKISKQRLIEQEFWAEAYASFALSKSSRRRLKLERPESYRYMQSFFKNPHARVVRPPGWTLLSRARRGVKAAE